LAKGKLLISKNSDDPTFAKTHAIKVNLRFVSGESPKSFALNLKVVDGCPKVTEITAPTAK